MEHKDLRALHRLHQALQPLLLRRTKASKGADGLPIIRLPPRTLVIEKLLFTPEEKDFYDALRTQSKVRFDAFVAEGRVLNNYASVLASAHSTSNGFASWSTLMDHPHGAQRSIAMQHVPHAFNCHAACAARVQLPCSMCRTRSIAMQHVPHAFNCHAACAARVQLPCSMCRTRSIAMQHVPHAFNCHAACAARVQLPCSMCRTRSIAMQHVPHAFNCHAACAARVQLPCSMCRTRSIAMQHVPHAFNCHAACAARVQLPCSMCRTRSIAMQHVPHAFNCHAACAGTPHKPKRPDNTCAVLQQMRQACDHPFLVLSRADTKNDITKIGELLLRRWQQRSSERAAEGSVEGGGGASSGSLQGGAAKERQAQAPTFLHNAINELKRKQSGMGGGKARAEPLQEQLPPQHLEASEVEHTREDAEESACTICLEVLEDPVLTSCAHVFCRECITSCLANAMGAAPCPVCRETVHRQDLITLPRASRFSVDLDTAWRPSSKLTALMEDLQTTLKEPLPPPAIEVPSTSRQVVVRKAVIISQWTAMLDLIQRPLSEEGIGYERHTRRASNHDNAAASSPTPTRLPAHSSPGTVSSVDQA